MFEYFLSPVKLSGPLPLLPTDGGSSARSAPSGYGPGTVWIKNSPPHSCTLVSGLYTSF